MGRGLNINKLTDKNEIIKKIINQANTLNKKIKSFANNGIEEHKEYVEGMLTGLVNFTETGTVSKSKTFFKDKSVMWLKKTLAGLHKVNNNDLYGTEKKYEKNMTDSIKRVQDYCRTYFEQKGYSSQFIASVIYDPKYFANLFLAFKEVGQGYGSDQTIEKVALSYQNTNTLNNKEVNKILTNIERSKNIEDRVKEERDALAELRNIRNSKGR